MDKLILVPAWITVWIIQIAIKTPVMIAGLVMVAIAYRYRHTQIGDCPWWIMPWINPEDWPGGFPGYPDTYPSFWVRRRDAEGWSEFRAFWWYHAIRNPADGLRNYKVLQLDISDPSKVKFMTNELLDSYEPRHMEQGRVYWYVAWIGIRAGFKINYVWSDDRYLEIKFGYRVDPGDAKRAPTPGSTFDVLGVSIASKFLLYRRY